MLCSVLLKRKLLDLLLLLLLLVLLLRQYRTAVLEPGRGRKRGGSPRSSPFWLGCVQSAVCVQSVFSLPVSLSSFTSHSHTYIHTHRVLSKHNRYTCIGPQRQDTSTTYTHPPAHTHTQTPTHALTRPSCLHPTAERRRRPKNAGDTWAQSTSRPQRRRWKLLQRARPRGSVSPTLSSSFP